MKKVKGYFSKLPNSDSEEQFYKIENYDCMEDFFMTITSASDIWNFCWSQGGVTAGRVDSDHAIFPYYTADKVSDAKSYTGAYTAIRIQQENANKIIVWEPFSSLAVSAALRVALEKNIRRNIYKNTAGTEIWFEEINDELKLSFRYGWTSSAQYGLVKKAVLTNLSEAPVKVSVLDGCKNIMPACVDAFSQNTSSVLLDAYKQTDLDEKAKLALFSLSSIVSDKAEPSECLFANTCWFSTEDEIFLSPDSPEQFAKTGIVEKESVVKGKRGAAFIIHSVELAGGKSENWNQVFDTNLDSAKVVELRTKLLHKSAINQDLEADILNGKKLMETYIAESDGKQDSNEQMTAVHHFENIMFNIMRGGFFANNGKINLDDFVQFVSQRNKAFVPITKKIAESLFADSEGFVQYTDLELAVQKEMNPQAMRLFYEYMPLTFSRRHGDPSRPWNKFNIHLRDKNGNPILNYEGNWRDIFQNWEALAWSFPAYIKNMTAKFLNAMTIEGFNPYRISREGIDWEVPEENNPWAHIGYWGDHQVIYLEKLLELYAKVNRTALICELNKKCYASANVPYRIKTYKEISCDPRNTIFFDRALSNFLFERSKTEGSDAKLVKVNGDYKNKEVALVSLASKLIQVVIAKMANFVPGGGIWLNTQRPEWNDANNALAGYGLSLVTLCYLYRFVNFLIPLFEESSEDSFLIPADIANCFVNLGKLYEQTPPESVVKDSVKRKTFTDSEGRFFEAERESLYAHGYGSEEENLSKENIVAILKSILNHIKTTILVNHTSNGLYHSYNTMKIFADKMEIENLQEMLEGQVAVLSAGILAPEEALEVLTSLRKSDIYEKRQNSYMLYPNKNLPAFEEKNCILQNEIERYKLSALVAKTENAILTRDCNGNWHFNGEFRNARFLQKACDSLAQDKKPTEQEQSALHALYEKTFNHQQFTGRSGTFYAYEGLGSIYWHMVSKLLLAAQENTLSAINANCSSTLIENLKCAYYDIRSGLGFNKDAELYGAFPCDPYSHTPSGQGAKQPGMTGQVKEEVLTRWGELGLDIVDGCAVFVPTILKESEFFADGTLHFTWCGTPVTYTLLKSPTASAHICVNGNSREGNSLTKAESLALFFRTGEIKQITVEVFVGAKK